MFTGLVDDVGLIEHVADTPAGRELRIRCRYTDLTHGESIAVNGACLTVREHGQSADGQGWFTVAAVVTTLARTTIGDWVTGGLVNLDGGLLDDGLGGLHDLLDLDDLLHLGDGRLELGLHHGGVLALRHPRGLLAPPGLLAHAVAQVVELGAADVTLEGALDLLDLRRVERERALHAHPEALLAHREGLAGGRALALDHSALEHLHPAALALDDLEMHAHGVARTEVWVVVAELHPLQCLDNGHAGVSSWDESGGENSTDPVAGAGRTCDWRHSSIAP